MKKSVVFYNNLSNPSYLGADKLWADFSNLSRVDDLILGNDYDGI